MSLNYLKRIRASNLLRGLRIPPLLADLLFMKDLALFGWRVFFWTLVVAWALMGDLSVFH